MSPMQAHCNDIKQRYQNAKTVFIGPCVAKKDEAEHYEGIDLLAFDKAMREYIINSGTPELKKGVKELLEFLKQF